MNWITGRKKRQNSRMLQAGLAAVKFNDEATKRGENGAKAFMKEAGITKQEVEENTFSLREAAKKAGRNVDIPYAAYGSILQKGYCLRKIKEEEEKENE
jgi:hypothetical protein